MEKSLQPVKPVAVTMDAGMLDPENQSFMERFLGRLLKVHLGGFWDWNVIAAWADQLPGLMKIG